MPSAAVPPPGVPRPWPRRARRAAALDPEQTEIYGWILDYAIRHECDELIQVLPKEGLRPPTVGALALRSLRVSFAKEAESASPSLTEWHVTTILKAHRALEISAPEDVGKWIDLLKERVVLCLHAERKLKAAREAMEAFYEEPPVLLTSCLADKRSATGSKDFNQAMSSRKCAVKALQALANDLHTCVNKWIEALPPCLLDQLAEATHAEDFQNLAEPESQQAGPENQQVVQENHEAVGHQAENVTVSKAQEIPQQPPPQPQVQPSRKRSRGRKAAVEQPPTPEPVVKEVTMDEAPEAVHLRTRSNSLLKQIGPDPLEDICSRVPEPAAANPKARLQLVKSKQQPEWSEGEEEGDNGNSRSALPTLGEAPELMRFKPLSEIGNNAAPQAVQEPSRNRGRKRIRWTTDEEDCLRDGVRKYGEGNWASILSDTALSSSLNNIRTAVDLKDKWRNMNK